MARQRRRGGGFSPPELRGTLGTLLRTTLQQAGVVREALERGAREGRARIDEFRSERSDGRRRQEALAELGEIVLELIRRGEIDVDELPEARNIVDHLDELDADEAAHNDQRDSSPTVAPPSRRRFDDRDRDDGTVSATRWTPPTRRREKPTRVWKPNLEAAVDEPKKPDPAPRKGGISFGDDDDSDLADYMHPDDVPAKKDG
jgi:hypothetical protein